MATPVVLGYILIGIAVILALVAVLVMLIRTTTTDEISSSTLSSESTTPAVIPREDMCFPGCEGTNKCSIESMYNGGSNGLCSRKECNQESPVCCCYDFQCGGCPEFEE